MPAGITKSAPRIVVGVDGSASSRVALRWAVQLATLTGGSVDAIIAWHIPAQLQSYNAWAPLYLRESDDLEEAAKKTVEAVINTEVQPEDIHLVRSEVVHGHPARALLDAAVGADLLVVGSRGHGAFAEALLGSVGQYCVHHAHCPVLIMRGDPA